jgi:hypothetical protein
MLPQDIYQTAKVAKILLLLEKWKRKEFKGKSLGEIDLDNNIYYSSESENEDRDLNLQPILHNVTKASSENAESNLETTTSMTNLKDKNINKKHKTVKRKAKGQRDRDEFSDLEEGKLFIPQN